MYTKQLIGIYTVGVSIWKDDSSLHNRNDSERYYP